MKVLHVIPSLSLRHGGPSVALPAIAEALVRQGIEVTIATTDDDGPGRRKKVALGETIHLRSGAQCLYFRKSIEFYKISRALSRWLQAHVTEFDLVHIHALFSFSSVVAARAARRARVPYVVRPLGVLNKWGLENRRRFVKRWSLKLVEFPILRGAVAIHYTAEAERQEAAMAHPGIALLPSVVIPIPITVPHGANADQFHARFPATLGRRIIIFLSRIDPKKGIELLLSAFREIQGEFPDALLVIAGSGKETYIETLREKARELGCDKDILWPGFLEGEDKAALFAAATLFVLPSFSENFGIAAAEALAAGVPSILSERVAIAHDAAAADAATMVSCDSFKLAEAIRQLFNDEAMRERISARGRAFILERYSAETIGAQLAALYDEAIKKDP